MPFHETIQDLGLALGQPRMWFVCSAHKMVRVGRDHEAVAISLVKPGLCPLSRSAFFTHSFSVCDVQPILLAIETIADHRDACSCS